MKDDDMELCCCEYYDLSNERNHILACFCNCVDLDEAVDSLVKGKKVSERNSVAVMNTMRDRLRVPWIGGAKQISFDTLLPVFILPIMFLLASISLWWTVFSFTTVAIFLSLIFNFFIKTIPNTKFFFVWTVTSIVLLYFIFEFVVIPLLEILVEENIALSILIFGFVMCLYLMKIRANQLTTNGENEAELIIIGKDVEGFYPCRICDNKIPDKDHHCVWFDCCISRHNQCLFILALFFAISALLYSSNLTLTSVCHPFEVYKAILLPDDCSDVYFQFEKFREMIHHSLLLSWFRVDRHVFRMVPPYFVLFITINLNQQLGTKLFIQCPYQLSLSFVSAIYSIFIAFLLWILLLQQILLVSVGIPLKDWIKLPFLSKLCLGLNTNRPHNRGVIKNWLRLICWNRNYYTVVNREV